MPPKLKPVLSRLIAPLLLGIFFLAVTSVSRGSPRVVHVFVALADNQHQGIIPVPPALGNGRDPQRNLYWGAAYGVKTYFNSAKNLELVWSGLPTKSAILEPSVFTTAKNDLYL